MAKVIERLDDTKIKKAIKGAGKITSAAYLPDGKGLYLRVTPGGTSTFPYRWFHKGSQLAHRPPQQRLRYARRRRSRGAASDCWRGKSVEPLPVSCVSIVCRA
jgi:hypothetical protein